jgi:hypothetical protein
MRDSPLHQNRPRRKARGCLRLPVGNRLRRGSRAALHAAPAAHERGIEKSPDPRDPSRTPTLPRVHWLEMISKEHV